MSSRLAQFTRRLVTPVSQAPDVTPPPAARRHLYIEGVTPANRWAKELIASKKRHAR